MAEGVVHIFAPGRRAVFDFILLGDHRLDGLGHQPAGHIVIQMEINRFHMRVFLQKAGKGHRQLALLDLFLRLVHPGQRQQVVPPPVNSVQLTEGGVGHDVNGALAQMDSRIFHTGGQGKRIVLVAAAQIPVEPGFANPAQAAEPRLAGLVKTYKDHISMALVLALINPPGLNTVVQNLLVNAPASEIGHNSNIKEGG